MRIDYELSPTVVAEYAMALSPPPWWMPRPLARRLYGSGPYEQAVELSKEGITDLIRANGQPRTFPWDAFHTLWVARTWIAILLHPDGEITGSVEAILLPIDVLPNGLDGLRGRFPRLAGLEEVRI